MTTPIYALPQFSESTSALGAYGLNQQIPSRLLGVGHVGVRTNSMGHYAVRTQSLNGILDWLGGSSGSTDSESGSSDTSGIADFLKKSFGGVLETGVKALQDVVQKKINQMAGYKDTKKVQQMKDGRVAAIVQSPQGTLMALFPDGSMEPYLPSNAASAPTTTEELLSGKTMGIGVVVAVVAIAAIFLMRRKR